MNFPSLETFKLGQNPNPCCGGVPSALFLAPSSNVNVLNYMREKYAHIFHVSMYNAEIPLYYLPLNLVSGHIHDCLAYNNPWLEVESARAGEYADRLTERIRRENGLEPNGCGIAIMDFNDPTLVVDYYPIDPDKEISPQLNEWTHYLMAKVHMSNISMATVAIERGKVSRIDDAICVDVPRKMVIRMSKDFTPKPSDDLFDAEGYELAEEIRLRMNILRERGFVKLLGEIVEEMQGSDRGLSRLVVTSDYRIFLSDWGNREVVMLPLPKTIFLLFLNHPEGILFKELIDYREEMLAIYKRITQREHIDDVLQSIDALCDPMNNSINEKCSRIRAAFLEVVAPHMADSYYIIGKRGGAKRIALERKLVILP